MSSKRNHAIRSRKTYKDRMNAARCALAGSHPKGASSGVKIGRNGRESAANTLGFLKAFRKILRKKTREQGKENKNGQ